MIDPRLVNVETPPPECGMGCQVRRDCLGSRSDVFEDAIRQVPQSQWDEMAAQMGNADKLVPYTLDQGREGSCVGNGSSWGFDFCQSLQVGPSRIVRTSPMSLYKRIGQTASSGAVIGDALEELRTRGILPLDTPENRAAFAHVHPATGFARPLPAGWEETAASFRLEEYWEIATTAGMVSALLTGYAVVYGRSGHCICGVRPVLERGVWYVRYKNSWGEWGDNGFGYDTLSFLERQNKYGWYALRTVTYRP
jgi:hypothetical protein